MNVLIVDDEPPARDRLRDLLNRLPDYQPCGEASNGAEALRLAISVQPDIVLLDIQMPGLDGLETARRLALLPQPPAVIFVTAYSKHALEAFDTHAVAYLLKPVRLERLEQALVSACHINRAQLSNLAAVHTEAGRTHVCARLGQRLALIPLADVFYFQADQKYVTVRHRHGEALIEESLKTLEQEIGSRGVRVHRNALAMAAQVAGLEKAPDGGCALSFHDIPDRLEVSRRHLPAIRLFLRDI
ncbi:LytR/AlgR family response regulator transcription factor [Candidatus Contendibacter odensensis]|uniref:Response regulator receiver protein n=1 Tax=Candidatus Contendobacter odensis Run_B_J11 TaxID=1400861 RepID=A0A7U7GBE4_9GAMM|nr:LytTR family DNA-binding domain-containing protein [Candidatus Contendobacter odensis]MBK8754986.1 response regulator transcription factor [Candidatus Competibacteraceae bacterium]CDH45163.1 Response regulator receiver protein [Candidatus Contendobacter odensis Run_B_J11]